MAKEHLPHDAAYKQFFRNRDMVASLLRSFVPESFIADLDFATLEPYPTAHVTDDFRERHNDIVWRARWKDTDVYLLLLMEFQSNEDWWMAVRILAYTALLWQDLIREGKLRRGDTLPPVFPLVLYNGIPAWTAPREVSELLSCTHEDLMPYQPRQRYFVLDERRVPQETLEAGEGIATLLLRLERELEIQGILPILDDVLRQLQGEQYLELRRLFTAWVANVVFKRANPTGEIPQFKNLQEARDMLAEQIDQWKDKYIQQGMLLGEARGISIGEAKGISIGEARGEARGIGLALLSFLTARFGTLPEAVSASIAEISDRQTLLDLSQSACRDESFQEFLEILEQGGKQKQ